MKARALFFILAIMIPPHWAFADALMQKEAARIVDDFRAHAAKFKRTDEEHKSFDKALKARAMDEAGVAALYHGRAAHKSGTVLSKADRKKYLSDRRNDDGVIPASHPLISEITVLLTAPAKTETEKLVLLHDFVSWRLSYDSLVVNSKVETSKKKWVFCQMKARHKDVVPFGSVIFDGCGEAVPPFDLKGNRIIWDLYSGIDNCYGYAYLFVALTRAAGIPARIAHQPWHSDKENGTWAHQWAQVYVGGRWLVIDPTFDDDYDEGNYGDSDVMTMNYAYFLLTTDEAKKIDAADPDVKGVRDDFQIEEM